MLSLLIVSAKLPLSLAEAKQSTLTEALSGASFFMSNNQWFIDALSGDEIERMSKGRIKRLSRNAAAGLVGSWMVETGDPTLSNLDVVERGNGNAGRGLSQYTGVRRGPYDAARASALRAGQDVNSREWQLQYFADEYAGDHDRGGSLIGWTRALENAPASGTPSDYARHFTDSYFRPGVPHMDRRMKLAEDALRGAGSVPQSGSSSSMLVNNETPMIEQGPPIQQDEPTGPGELIRQAAKFVGLDI